MNYFLFVNHMQRSHSDSQVILVTGGTSGLGLEIVKIFLDRGYYVVATGRQSIDMPGYEKMFRLYQVDFNDLQQTADIVKKICDNHNIDLIINNAGMISPPVFTTTKNGFESTFQVNFLAHLLLNDIIIRRFGNDRPLKIAAVSSMVYKIGNYESGLTRQSDNYNPLRSYSDSKLLLALMCKLMGKKYRNVDLKCFSFDPGIFSSSIFRMQNPFLRFLYKIAAPFMRKPSSVAAIIADILIDSQFSCGAVYNLRKKIKPLKNINIGSVEDFIERCHRIIITFSDSI